MIGVNQNVLQFYVTMTQTITVEAADAIDNFVGQASSIASIVLAKLSFEEFCVF